MEAARERTGALPVAPEWRQVTRAEMPSVLRTCFDQDLMERMGWKLAPLRTSPERFELTIDNDCILRDVPEAIRARLETGDGCVFAENVDRCLGVFDSLCPPGAFHAGVGGLAPGADLEGEIAEVLRGLAEVTGAAPRLVSDIEEQGLQTAAMCRLGPMFLVRKD